MPIRLTRAVKVLLFAQLGIFILQNVVDQFLGGNLLGIFALTPSSFVLHGYLWQIVTYAFFHADVLHILLNLLMLVFIGGELEASWGTRRFTVYYFFCAIFSGLCYLLIQLLFPAGGGLNTPMVGSSGAIYGLLIAYGILFGERVMLFMMLFPMKAKQFVWILAAVEFFTAVFSRKSGLSSVAHLGGMLGGFLFLLGLARWKKRASNPRRNASKKQARSGHLKLIINNAKNKDSEREDSGSGPKTWH